MSQVYIRWQHRRSTSCIINSFMTEAPMSKSMGWFLYDTDFLYERITATCFVRLILPFNTWTKTYKVADFLLDRFHINFNVVPEIRERSQIPVITGRVELWTSFMQWLSRLGIYVVSKRFILQMFHICIFWSNFISYYCFVYDVFRGYRNVTVD